MSTPHKPPNAGRAATTPKIGRDIQQSDMSFHSSAVHQSGSKNMQSKMTDLTETFIKRKTELAELMRSAGKKRMKMSESGRDMFRRADLRDLNDFPNLSGLDSFVEEDQEGATSQPFSAQTGSLLFDNSFVFSPGQPELNFTRNTNSAANFFESSVTDTAEYKENKTQELQQDENLEVRTTEEDEDECSETEEQQRLDVSSPNPHLSNATSPNSHHSHNNHHDKKFTTDPSNSDDVDITDEGADSAAVNRSSNSEMAEADLSYRSQKDSPNHSTVSGTPGSGKIASPQHTVSLDVASDDNHGYGENSGVAVAKVLTFSPTTSGGVRRGFSQPPLVAVQSTETSDESVWRNSVLSPRSPLLQHQYRSVNSGPQSQNGTDEDAAELSTSVSVRRYEDHVDEEASPSSYSNIYRDNLLHQLKVTTAKNEMLQGKLRDIEELVDRNYGSISERSKLLTAERNKLERQRSQMEDDLVATKEELLFIRAQLQNKSGRISELEMELLEAQRRLIGTSTETTSSGSGSEDEEEDIEVLAATTGTPHSTNRRQTEEQRQAAFFRPDPNSNNSPSAEIAATLSQEEATAMYAAGLQMDLHAQQDAREIELLKNLLVEQEKKLIELQSSGEPPSAWEQQIQAAVQDNVQLLGALDTAETERNLLIEQVAVLEQRLQEAEQLAFEEEARAAALELELFKSLDDEHERVMSEALGGIAQAVTTMAPQVVTTPPKLTQEPSAVVMQFSSGPSPCLPLRRHPAAPLRIPREGYAGLLMLTAVLLATIWVLLLVVGFLYLGILEQRFGVDILSDGGVYDQLFMLRGPRALAGILRESIAELDFADSLQYCTTISQDFAMQLTDFISSSVIKVQTLLR